MRTTKQCLTRVLVVTIVASLPLAFIPTLAEEGDDRQESSTGSQNNQRGFLGVMPLILDSFSVENSETPASPHIPPGHGKHDGPDGPPGHSKHDNDPDGPPGHWKHDPDNPDAKSKKK